MAKRNVKTFRFGDYADYAKEELRVERPRPQAEREVLTGLVQGLPASDLEERRHRALNRYRVGHVFQQEIPTAYSLPSQERKVDFFERNRQAVEVDGFISHYYQISQKQKTFTRDLFLNEALNKFGLPNVVHVPYWELEDQERADRSVRSMYR